MKLGYTIFYVPDVEATLQFFAAAFKLERGYTAESGEYGELKTGETTLSFAAESLVTAHGAKFRFNRPDEPPLAVEVGFVTDDVDAAYNHALSAGATEFQAPKQKPWGQRVALVRDPNGILVELCTPMS